MTKRDWSDVGLVVAAGAFFGWIGYLVGSYGRVAALDGAAYTFLNIEAGDWLQSVSGFGGVVFAIWATLRIEERRKKREIAMETTALHQSLMAIRAICGMTAETIPAVYHPNAVSLCHIMLVSIVNWRGGFDASRAGVKIYSLPFWASLENLADIFQSIPALIERCRELTDDTPMNAKVSVYNDTISKLTLMAAACNTAIGEIDKHTL